MRKPPSSNAHTIMAIMALLTASFLVELRGLLDPLTLPLEALAWTTFAALGYVALIPWCWFGRRWAFAAAVILAALNVIATSFNPVDPFYLTHWQQPLRSLLVVLEGYALPLPLIFFAYRAYRGSAAPGSGWTSEKPS